MNKEIFREEDRFISFETQVYKAHAVVNEALSKISEWK